MRLVYRLRQFWNALFAAPSPEDLRLAASVLTPAQMDLFLRQQRSEQAHGLAVLKKIRALDPHIPGAQHPDLQIAALLHDSGKSCHPLRLWERAAIVAAQRLFPRKAPEWGRRGMPAGWSRPFVIAEKHPAWGAELAAEAGASPLAVAIIRSHQSFRNARPVSLETQLLSILQSVDGDS